MEEKTWEIFRLILARRGGGDGTGKPDSAGLEHTEVDVLPGSDATRARFSIVLKYEVVERKQEETERLLNMRF